MRGLPDGSAGLPRRCAPRNDKGGKWRAGWDAPAGLPRRCAPRNDKLGRDWGGRPSFRIYSHNAVIASPLGRGNPVGFVMRNTQTMLSLPYASVGSPRRDFVLLRDDKVKRRGMPNPTLPGANPQSFPLPLPYRELGSSTRSPSTYWWIKPEIKLW